MSPGTLRRIAVLVGLLGAGCSITTRVDPLPAGPLTSVCVQENEAVWSKDFLPLLRDQFSRHGIATTVYQGEKPADCRYHVEYEARWDWDLAVYLKYADVRVFDDSALIGQATYDARNGSGRVDKLGHTDQKFVPLLDALLASVNRAAALNRP